MPFGAELLEDGRVRFRLWAPAAERVELCLESVFADDDTAGGGEAAGGVLPMTRVAAGWFGCATVAAGKDSRYRYRIDSEAQVPDPASRFQPDDVHGPSAVIDPAAYAWQDASWRGRPWEESVIYELHVGSFTRAGTFAGVRERLDYLAELGISAVELMPLADFPGDRNWGYDGTCLFAPDSRYGTPDDLKALVDAAHARGLMVFLDVVYNHFGPEGNYLHLSAPDFFTDRHATPWGAAINLDGGDSHWVREFFIENALFWLEEYHLDGLRLDAVHALIDSSRPDILTELAGRVRSAFPDTRHIHLVLENDDNAARYLAGSPTDRGNRYDAQWNDDFHHALHVTLTGESGGYYRDYAHGPAHYLARCLTEGFAYQGESSPYRDNAPRGESSAHLPATAFVSFLQNHDQIGNRAFGDRIGALCEPAALRAATALLLLAPSPPLLFMGQEWGCTQPFCFFCDFGPGLADKVAAGRREELSRFSEFRTRSVQAHIPDPSAVETFEASVLDWRALDDPQHAVWLRLHRELLAIRRQKLTPRLDGLPDGDKGHRMLSDAAFSAHWSLGDGSVLRVAANLAGKALPGISLPSDSVLYSTHADAVDQSEDGTLPPWSVTWYLGGNDRGQ